jgi:hypothetical protein
MGWRHACKLSQQASCQAALTTRAACAKVVNDPRAATASSAPVFATSLVGHARLAVLWETPSESRVCVSVAAAMADSMNTTLQEENVLCGRYQA